MVMMTREQQAAYPRFAAFVKETIPATAKDMHVWNMLMLCAGMYERRVAGKLRNLSIEYWKTFLCWDVPPKLDVVLRQDWNGGKFGENVRGKPIILVNAMLVHSFENAKRETPAAVAAAAKFMRAGVLHELVHFYDFAKDGRYSDDPVGGGPRPSNAEEGERGHVFELMAFGGTVRANQPW